MENERIKLVDSPMGTGKTSWAIQYINELPEEQKVIYITPFLAECERIKNSCPNRTFDTPTKFNGEGRKSVHFTKLISKGKNIASTHALFAQISDEMIEILRQSDYILILDEAFDVVQPYDLWKGDKEYSYYSKTQKEQLTIDTINSLRNKNCISINPETFGIDWIDKENNQPKYAEFKRLCDRKLLYIVGNELVLWTFPCDIFLPGIFNEIYILTYQFRYQLQSYYFEYFNVEFSEYHVIEKSTRIYELSKTNDKSYELDFIAKIKPLINIYEGRMNKLTTFWNNQGKVVSTALSKTWYSKVSKENMEQIRNCVVNFLTKHVGTSKSSERMWTCFKSDKLLFKHVNLPSKNWVAFNSRSTNEYRNKLYVAYCVNRYIDPFYILFFKNKNIRLNKDGFALAEMLQFIFRSAIRDSKPIKIYIPSERMRNLLINYLNGGTIDFKNAEEDLEIIISEQEELFEE